MQEEADAAVDEPPQPQQEQQRPLQDGRDERVLLLFLGLMDNQRISCQDTAWEYLTIRDLVNVKCVSKCIYTRLSGPKCVEYTRCRDGRDYLVPFPGYPGLLSTKNDAIMESNTSSNGTPGSCAGLYSHQMNSISRMYEMENSSTQFGALRGGILADAPGLGKTITMIALIASTAGVRPVTPPEFWSRSSDEDWKAYCQNPMSRSEILIALKPLRDYIHNTDNIFSALALGQFPTLKSLESHVRGTLMRRYSIPHGPLELFSHNLVKIHAGLDKGNRKLLSSPQGRRLLWERLLVPTSATLIIVPDALLEHWCNQVQLHLNLALFADKTENPGQQEGEQARQGSGPPPSSSSSSSSVPAAAAAAPAPAPADSTKATRGVVYVDGIGDLADIIQAGGSCSLSNMTLQAHVPGSWELSQYLMVITTFTRCRMEFAKEVWAGRMDRSNNRRGTSSTRGSNKRFFDAVDTSSGSPSHRSPLIQMRWLRIVVDEGHELGTHEAEDDVTRLINEVAAERRWVLSGTPMTGDEDSADYISHALDQLQRLLFFLRHSHYGIISEGGDASGSIGAAGDSTSKNKALSAWAKAVKQPFLAKRPEGRERLLAVLKDIMVMHRKEDIDLPKPRFRQVERDCEIPLQIEEEHQQVHSTHGHDAFMAILNKYLHSEEYQSLVDKAQAEYIVHAIQKARRNLLHRGGPACQESPQIRAAAASECHVNEAKKDLRPIKAVVYSSQHNILLSVTDQLIRSLKQENIAEVYEREIMDIGDVSSELARFRNGVKEYRTCPVCQRENGVRSKVRAGRDYCKATLLEVVSISTTLPVRFLIEPERIARTYNVTTEQTNGEPLSNYGKSAKFWRSGHLLQVNVSNSHPFLPTRKTEEYWDSVGADKCRDLAVRHGHRGQDWYFGSLPDDDSIIDSLVDVKLVKWQGCGTFHNHSRWYTGPRLSDAPIEKVQEDVFLLSLDAGLSHGLDLSFVTHLFLLEPIEDAALLEQVTSRAHRLGATGPVTVATINVFLKCSNRMQSLIDSGPTPNGHVNLGQGRESTLSKIVCEHCYRQFDSKDKAKEHEENFCPRNPASSTTVDIFHLSSVYREIRPPPLA